jgi:Methylmalonic aciduria and homocystinuria type D protein
MGATVEDEKDRLLERVRAANVSVPRRRPLLGNRFRETLPHTVRVVCRQFMAFAKAVCDRLVSLGHWADYIDPCSGLPVRPLSMRPNLER